MSNNIKPINADGVHELLVVGTALTEAMNILNANKISSSNTSLNEALIIINKIIDEGFDSI